MSYTAVKLEGGTDCDDETLRRPQALYKLVKSK